MTSTPHGRSVSIGETRLHVDERGPSDAAPHLEEPERYADLVRTFDHASSGRRQ